jgi:nucleotide-binding universal stress UspA family protein
MKRILHPTDFSTAARPAFRAALAWARRWHARLHLLHVMTPPVVLVEEPLLTERQWRDLEVVGLRAARRRLASLERQARQAGVTTSTAVVRSYAPFSAIVKAARRPRADLLVLGTHGRTGLARVALGSVAERVVALAPCPVLTVRG